MNVMTLFPGGEDHGAYVSSRGEALARQCYEAGLHCIGLQETRSRKAGYTHFYGYHMLSASAADTSHGGTQCWIADTWSSPARDFTIRADHLHIVFADPHRLGVRLQHPRLHLLLLALHAPNGMMRLSLTLGGAPPRH